MTNVADALADILETWHVPGGLRSEEHRGSGTSFEDWGFWEVHRTAVEYLLEIEEGLISMEEGGQSTLYFRESLPAWYAAVFAVTTPWGYVDGSVRRVADKGDIRMLRSLGMRLEELKHIPEMDDESYESLAAALAVARRLVVEDQGLEDHTRRYILGLIRQAEAALEDHVVDTIRLRRLSMEIGGAMTTVSELKLEGDPQRKKWQEGAKNILRSISDKVLQKAIDSGVDQIAGAIGQAIP